MLRQAWSDGRGATAGLPSSAETRLDKPTLAPDHSTTDRALNKVSLSTGDIRAVKCAKTAGCISCILHEEAGDWLRFRQLRRCPSLSVVAENGACPPWRAEQPGRIALAQSTARDPARMDQFW